MPLVVGALGPRTKSLDRVGGGGRHCHLVLSVFSTGVSVRLLSNTWFLLSGLEEVGENETQRRRLSSRGQDKHGHDNEERREAEEGDGFETLGEFVQAGATGAKRKLMNWKASAAFDVRAFFLCVLVVHEK